MPIIVQLLSDEVMQHAIKRGGKFSSRFKDYDDKESSSSRPSLQE